jgi:hypothetical protein
VSEDRRAWLRTFVDEAFYSRRAARFAEELNAHRGRPAARRAFTLFPHRRGLRLGAPLLREGQEVARHAGRLTPIVRYLAVLSDYAHRMGNEISARPEADADRRDRARMMATALATLLDDEAAAIAAADADDIKATRALTRVGKALERRRYLLGNPLLGLTLNHALIAADARSFAEVAPLAWRRVPTALERANANEGLRARREALVACVASLSAHRAQLETDRLSRTTERWHVRSLGLRRDETARLLAHVDAPPDVEGCAALVPAGDRGFVLEHVVLAARVDGRVDDAEREWIEALAARLEIEDARRRRFERRVGDFVEVHRDRFNPLDHAERFEAARPPVAVRFSRVVRQNLDALVMEIRETGDLALLLAKRAKGTRLTPDEARRLRSQLVDVAKAVPSLAVFSLPGGIILVPLLLKLLPFDLRTSAFKTDAFRAFEGEDGSLEGAPILDDDEPPAGGSEAP